ncbi:hypothetical protein E2C01_063063 [Portunus trituberculatus]|uniref:Uncharacterized protein n=1 Tax=Portunus trituberculatus TaxID=210409 RepID=A0A5B7HFD4_PORTR|nr:hypothetical protein [Portunus trituberculatus]
MELLPLPPPPPPPSVANLSTIKTNFGSFNFDPQDLTGRSSIIGFCVCVPREAFPPHASPRRLITTATGKRVFLELSPEHGHTPRLAVVKVQAMLAEIQNQRQGNKPKATDDSRLKLSIVDQTIHGIHL